MPRHFGVLAHLVERLHRTQEVGGSNPPYSTTVIDMFPGLKLVALTANLTATFTSTVSRQRAFNQFDCAPPSFKVVVLVDFLRYRDSRVSQDELGIPRIHTQILQQCCSGVPEVMQGDDAGATTPT